MTSHLQKIFRTALVASILLIVAGIALELGFESLLPQELQDYLNAESEAELTLSEIITGLFALFLIPPLIAAYVGLFLWQSWARILFLLTMVYAYVLTLFLGPFVHSGPTYVCYDLASVLSGLIIGLAYFSPLAERFQKKNPPPLPG